MGIALLYLALLAVAFFFLIVRPQRRQLATRQALIASIEVGDEIITAGGIYGTVRECDETSMQVEVASGVVLTVAREAVARRREEPEAAAVAEETDEGEPPAARALDGDADATIDMTEGTAGS